MNEYLQRTLEGGYKSPVWKKQNSTTWRTLQNRICTECALKIPNEFIIMSDAMAIDSKNGTSSDAKLNDIIDWIEWDDEKKNFLSIFRNKVECSECGKEIKGEVKFKGYND